MLRAHSGPCFGKPAEIHRAIQRKRFREGLADWLCGYDFTTWATFTWRADIWPEPKISGIQRHVEDFIDSMAIDPAFYVIERGGQGGRLHAHGLLGDAKVSRRGLWWRWHRRFGRGSFHQLKGDGTGVRLYCAKYAVKDDLWWRIKHGGCFEDVTRL